MHFPFTFHHIKMLMSSTIQMDILTRFRLFSCFTSVFCLVFFFNLRWVIMTNRQHGMSSSIRRCAYPKASKVFYYQRMISRQPDMHYLHIIRSLKFFTLFVVSDMEFTYGTHASYVGSRQDNRTGKEIIHKAYQRGSTSWLIVCPGFAVQIPKRTTTDRQRWRSPHLPINLHLRNMKMRISRNLMLWSCGFTSHLAAAWSLSVYKVLVIPESLDARSFEKWWLNAHHVILHKMERNDARRQMNFRMIRSSKVARLWCCRRYTKGSVLFLVNNLLSGFKGRVQGLQCATILVDLVTETRNFK